MKWDGPVDRADFFCLHFPWGQNKSNKLGQLSQPSLSTLYNQMIDQ